MGGSSGCSASSASFDSSASRMPERTCFQFSAVVSSDSRAVEKGARVGVLAEDRASCAAEEVVRLEHDGAEGAVRVRRRVADLHDDHDAVVVAVLAGRIVDEADGHAVDLQSGRAVLGGKVLDAVARGEGGNEFVEVHIGSFGSRFATAGSRHGG